MANSIHNFVNHTLKSSFYSGLSGSFIKVLVPINVLLVIASLTPYQYGVYKLAFSIFIVVNALLLSGINGLVLNDSSNYLGINMEGKAKRLLFEFFVLRILLGIVACLLFYFGSQILADHYSPGIAEYLKILAVLFMTDSIITVIDITLKAKLDFLGSSLVSVIPEITKFFLICYFSFFAVDGLNIIRLFWTIFFSNIISAIVLAIYAIGRLGLIKSIPSSDRFIILKMFKNYGKWAIAKNYISSFVDSSRLWIIRFFISTEAVAIYSVANSLVVTLKKFIPIQFMASLIPRYIGEGELLKKIYIRSTKYSIWIFTGVAIVSFFVVPPLVKLLMPQYIVSIPYFKLLLVVILLNSMILNKQIIYSLRKQKFLFKIAFVELLSVLLFGVLFVKLFGLYGIILEVFITELLMAYIIYFYLRRIRPDLSFPWTSLFVFNQEDRYWGKYLWSKLREKFRRI